MDKYLKLVKINSDYCDYLRKYDSRVPYNYGMKDTRPFIGILFNVENKLYFAPISSPKLKHLKMKQSIDFMKLDEGNLGVVNLNNMIPVKGNFYNEIDFEQISDIRYRRLLKKQYYYLNRNKESLYSFSRRLYKLYINNNLDKKIFNRCCNFKLLEEKCDIFSGKEVKS